MVKGEVWKGDSVLVQTRNVAIKTFETRVFSTLLYKQCSNWNNKSQPLP